MSNNIFKRLTELYNTKQERLMLADIHSSVAVSVINGALYLTVKGIPVEKLSSDCTVGRILERISDLISVRIECERQQQDN